MKRIMTFLFGIFALGLLVLNVNAQSETGLQIPHDTISLSLDQCLEIALSENLTIKIANYEIEKKDYSKKSTYASLYPQINIAGTYQKTIKKQKMFMEMGGEVTGITVGMSNTWNGTLTAAMPLVNPQLWKSLQISEQDVELAVEQSRASKIDMVYTVTECYYTVLLAIKSYEIYNTAFTNAKINYENVSRRYDLGLSSEYDKIRSNVEVANYEPEVLSALNAIEIAKWQLKAVIGMDLEIPIKCSGDLEDYTDVIHQSINSDFSLDHNSSLRQMDIQISQLDNMVKLYKRAYIPTLSAQFAYQYYAMDNTYNFSKYNWSSYSYAALALDIPIFSGFKKMNDIRQAKTQKTQLGIQRENTRRELYVSVQQILSTMETNLKQYQAAEASVDQAIRGYNISNKRYDTGKGTILEVNDSRLAAIQARLNLDNAIYKYMVAKAQLDKIIGKSFE